MAVTSIVAAVVVAAISAVLTYESAKAQAKTTEKIAEFNAEVATNEATSEQTRAKFAADQQRAATRRVLARQRALYGTAGVEENYGSPLMVQADSAMQGELDAQIIRAGGQARASSLQSRAAIETFRGENAANIERAGAVGAGTTLLSGAASGYRTYSLYQSPQNPGYAGSNVSIP
jgi:ABC-type Na+ efflux pump permease subunit